MSHDVRLAQLSLTKRLPGFAASASTFGGAIVSFTVTPKLPVDLVWCASVAVQVTVVRPSGKTAPDGWSQLTIGLGSTRSPAVTLKLTAAPAALVASTGLGEGRFSEGAVVSTTVTANEAAALLL